MRINFLKQTFIALITLSLSATPYLSHATTIHGEVAKLTAGTQIDNSQAGFGSWLILSNGRFKITQPSLLGISRPVYGAFDNNNQFNGSLDTGKEVIVTSDSRGMDIWQEPYFANFSKKIIRNAYIAVGKTNNQSAVELKDALAFNKGVATEPGRILFSVKEFGYEPQEFYRHLLKTELADFTAYRAADGMIELDFNALPTVKTVQDDN